MKRFPVTLPGAPRIYCAGPLFNQAERDEMTAISDRLEEAGYPVYLPHRDGMEFRHVHHVLVARGFAAPEAAHFLHAAIFALDIFQLVEACAGVVWNLNGRVPDEGAVSESAIAWSLGKPLVAYKEDVRTLITGRDNPLLVGLVDFHTISDLDELIPAVQREFGGKISPAIPIAVQTLPVRMQTAVSRGRTLWKTMQECSAPGDNDVIADVVTQLFAEGAPFVSTGRSPRTTVPRTEADGSRESSPAPFRIP